MVYMGTSIADTISTSLKKALTPLELAIPTVTSTGQVVQTTRAPIQDLVLTAPLQQSKNFLSSIPKPLLFAGIGGVVLIGGIVIYRIVKAKKE